MQQVSFQTQVGISNEVIQYDNYVFFTPSATHNTKLAACVFACALKSAADKQYGHWCMCMKL